MTNAEAINVLLNEWKCIDRNDGIHCNRKCESCDLVMDSAVLKDAYNLAIKALEAQRWIPCSERLPEEYGEYRITWITSYAPSKRFIGDSEYEITSVWDEERKEFKGEWLLDEYIRHYPDVKVIAWKPLEEPYREGES